MKFNVAGHIFEIEIPEKYDAEKYLKPYKPFEYNGSETTLFKLRVEMVENFTFLNVGEVKECFNDEAPYLWLFNAPSAASPSSIDYNFGFSYSKKNPDCILIPGADFTDSVVYVPEKYADQLTEFAISNAMMLLYTYNTTPHDTLLVHSSVAVKDGCAYSFLGRSGTGKSTHSRLWRENISGTELLNDDNPVIRVVDGEVKIYGSPWSGKTPCYKNEVYPLKGIVRLTQAPHNKIHQLRMLEAFASLMPSCSCMKWSRVQTDALHKTVEAVVRQVACWGLECLPDADAALTCYGAIAEKK